jgi:molybdate/tungstate transport system permease protein
VLWTCVVASLLLLVLILLPLSSLLGGSPVRSVREALSDGEVVSSLLLSLETALLTALICVILGTPVAYLLARAEFRAKGLVESLIDIPIVVPHPVVGIAILSVTGRNHAVGRFLFEIGVRLLGSVPGIVCVMVFVAIPFYVNAAKEGFRAVPPRLENVARTLGASRLTAFGRVTLPLARKSVLAGVIMSAARALSEFGAVVVIAYHPMTAPVLMYERFEAYGLSHSQPIALVLVALSLLLFVLLRLALHRGVPRGVARA